MKAPTHFFARLRFALALALVLMAGAAFAQNEAGALKMVKSLQMGESLGRMSYTAAKMTTTYQGIAAKLGPQKADELLKAELAVSVVKYREQWDKNLALAWAPLMTNEEFASIAAQKQNSPHAAKFKSLQNQAGATMKAKSETLLATVMAEALNRAFDKSAAKK